MSSFVTLLKNAELTLAVWGSELNHALCMTSCQLLQRADDPNLKEPPPLIKSSIGVRSVERAEVPSERGYDPLQMTDEEASYHRCDGCSNIFLQGRPSSFIKWKDEQVVGEKFGDLLTMAGQLGGQSLILLEVRWH